MEASTGPPASPAGSAAAGPASKSREVRLGLVLYGGVSLAIYINGAVREFFEAVHGRGVYKLLKVMTDSDVVVDVVSGTSAGGINGILLAYALGNDRDFGSSSGLWRRDGGISRLLRDPSRVADRWDSILDSEGYYQPAIEAALRYMPAYASERGEEPSRFDELDLYITGTDVDGALSTQFDDAGHAIDVKEHRAVFLLKHRAGRIDEDPRWPARKQPFNPRPAGAGDRPDVYEATTYEALAKLARITSCFPAAFAPVRVRTASDPVSSADARLQAWGRLGKESCFLDGGVLDNKPFTYTLEAIFSRRADRRVSRKLFYIEPDPEAFQRRMEASRPNLFQAVIAALIGIPGYESISNDLKLIAEHNSKVQQVNRIVQDCERLLGDPVDEGALTEAAAQRDPLYLRSRKVALSDRVIRGVLRRDGRSPLLAEEERARAAALVKAFDEAIPNADAPAIFERYDVLFRLRRAYHVAYRCYGLMFPEDNVPGAPNENVARYGDVLRAFNRHIEALEIIRAAMESLVDEAPFDLERTTALQVWQRVGTLYAALLGSPYPSLGALERGPQPGAPNGEPPDARPLVAFYEEIFARKRDIMRARGEEPGTTGTLLARTDAYERAVMKTLRDRDPDDPIARGYDRFTSIDSRVFPIELVAGLEQKDVIETIRISPRDADKGFSRRGFSDKVTGDAFYHFGGFFKRSWRSNDILWGRLDGACQLIETLLDRKRLIHVVADDHLRAHIRDRLGTAALLPSNLFPRAGARTYADLTEWFDQLFSDAPDRREQALDEKRFKGMVEILIEATQLEIIHNDLPDVITDALEEQAEWSEVQITRDAAAGPGVSPGSPREGAAMGSGEAAPSPGWLFRPLDGRVDPLIAIVAAAQQMRAGMHAVAAPGETANRPRETLMGRFFRESYRVGTETLTRDIPVRALLEILAVTLLVVSKCVLSAFGAQGERIRKNLLYRLGVALPLRVFYILVRLLRTRSSRRTLVLGGLMLVSGGVVLYVLLRMGLPVIEFRARRSLPPLWLTATSVVVLTISAVLLKLLGRPQGFMPAISHTVSVTPESQPVLAHFVVECRVLEAMLEVVLVEGSLSLREGSPRSTVRPRRLRIGLARRDDGARKAVRHDGGPPQWHVATAGRWQRFGDRILDARGIVAARRRDRLTLAECGDRTCVWLVVELLADERPWWRARWWWRRWRGRGSERVITVHSRRYLEDPLERESPAS